MYCVSVILCFWNLQTDDMLRQRLLCNTGLFCHGLFVVAIEILIMQPPKHELFERYNNTKEQGIVAHQKKKKVIQNAVQT